MTCNLPFFRSDITLHLQEFRNALEKHLEKGAFTMITQRLSTHFAGMLTKWESKVTYKVLYGVLKSVHRSSTHHTQGSHFDTVCWKRNGMWTSTYTLVFKCLLTSHLNHGDFRLDPRTSQVTNNKKATCSYWKIPLEPMDKKKGHINNKQHFPLLFKTMSYIVQYSFSFECLISQFPKMTSTWNMALRFGLICESWLCTDHGLAKRITLNCMTRPVLRVAWGVSYSVLVIFFWNKWKNKKKYLWSQNIHAAVLAKWLKKLTLFFL